MDTLYTPEMKYYYIVSAFQGKTTKFKSTVLAIDIRKDSILAKILDINASKHDVPITVISWQELSEKDYNFASLIRDTKV